MIDQTMVDSVRRYIENDDDLNPEKTKELLDAYVSLIEQNAELHKEVAKLKGERVFVVNDGELGTS